MAKRKPRTGTSAKVSIPGDNPAAKPASQAVDDAQQLFGAGKTANAARSIKLGRPRVCGADSGQSAAVIVTASAKIGAWHEE